MNRSSIPTHANASIIEAAYEAWTKDPNSVDPTWRAFFQGFMLGASGATPAAALAAVGRDLVLCHRVYGLFAARPPHAPTGMFVSPPRNISAFA